MARQQLMVTSSKTDGRRDFLKGALGVLGAALIPGGFALPAQAGSNAPEKTEVRVGFIPLTDCASVIVAAKMGFDKKYGITIVPSKEASWAAVRDKLVNGELDASHALYGMIYGVHLGLTGPKKDMAVLMTLNQNGQGITLSRQLKDKGVTNGPTLARLVKAEPREYTFAQTFPTGTHAMWLYYWLAAQGIDPLRDVKTIVVPPPQMVANMRVDNMDGYCVGEPWNARAIADNIGFSVATSQQIWPDHPEKVLGTTGEWVKQNPATARALIAALLEASRYIDDPKNHASVARLIAEKGFVNAPETVIAGRFSGAYEDGLGRKWQDARAMKFFDGGKVNYPYLSDGMWFLTQHKRWGLLKSDPDYLGVARQINQGALYKQAAAMARVPVPVSDMRSSKLMDGRVWDGKNPAAYASSFPIKA
ncbi:CmpA/NrtA family ABC transporter substrate-binding protein [Craterilacuibacter sp. RT1T]|uniref:CmpA/NrtA family ABC transporter substrate-binding protein n=1 Tax=Craterilacuibacter sp. RT1T TaxID=2942211 RepID=UPI0020BF5401|nr:CmpA/NrtA family ABC transporter substrate-binding protein [Craterilacuibacter sp. RT1T]MCL6263300.1 ABC transporter substrate-binding protein [Craterilacuibacter sp. RT1T]